MLFSYMFYGKAKFFSSCVQNVHFPRESELQALVFIKNRSLLLGPGG